MSRWIVSISTDNDNPIIFGPYSMSRAVDLATSFNRSAEKRPNADHEWLYATAYPIRPENITEIRRQFDIKR